MRILIIIAVLAFGFTARGQTNLTGNLTNLVQIPWVINPTNSTDYSRTNLPAWWDAGTNYVGWADWARGTNYASGVNTWMAWQAANHNWQIIAEYVSTNLVAYSGTNLPATLTNQIDTAGAVSASSGAARLNADGSVYFAGGGFQADTVGNVIMRETHMNEGRNNFYLNGSASLASGGLSYDEWGALAAAAYLFPTNAAPTHWTNGITPPDFWAQVYSADGSRMGWAPVWTNH
jgi:hypothetical protein